MAPAIGWSVLVPDTWLRQTARALTRAASLRALASYRGQLRLSSVFGRRLRAELLGEPLDAVTIDRDKPARPDVRPTQTGANPLDSGVLSRRVIEDMIEIASGR